jgi:hypothetical protein
LGYHGSDRGYIEIIFWPSANIKNSLLPSDTKGIEIRMPNVTVPTQATTYFCTYIDLPHDQDYHVVKTEPLSETNLLHHIVIYGCTDQSYQNVSGQVFDCSKNMGSCLDVTFLSAPGTMPFEYPSEAGVRIGPSYHYFVIQAHYSNPDGLSNIVDNS